MMFTDGAIHSIDFFDNFNTVYTEEVVTAETWQQKVIDGLYYLNNVITVPETAEKITFRYYSDNGLLLRSETVPVVRNGLTPEIDDNGEWSFAGVSTGVKAEGERGGEYRGPGTTHPDTPVLDDFYLNTTDQTIYYYNGSSWVEDSLGEELTWRWNAAIQDCVVNAQETGDLVKASNLWADKICANTILANTIKASSGFFDTIEVTGDSSFNGNISAKSLTLLNNCQVGSKLTMKTDGSLVCGEINSTGVFESSGITVKQLNFATETENYLNMINDCDPIFTFFYNLKSHYSPYSIFDYDILATGLINVNRYNERGISELYYNILPSKVRYSYWSHSGGSWFSTDIGIEIEGIYADSKIVKLSWDRSQGRSSTSLVCTVKLYDITGELEQSFDITEDNDAKITGFIRI